MGWETLLPLESQTVAGVLEKGPCLLVSIHTEPQGEDVEQI